VDVRNQWAGIVLHAQDIGEYKCGQKDESVDDNKDEAIKLGVFTWHDYDYYIIL
jgi:hypothetical protein